MIRVVELFSGIGAQRMALILAGIPHEVIAVSEINRHAIASYTAIYGDCPNMGDITKVDRLPKCDLVTYSFPCQDLSIAGNRKGMTKGTRSGLVWEVVRLLESERERPDWLLMENVPQVLTSPLWMELVGRLEAMGYRSKWAKLDSSRFGSAQKRIRAFMVSRMGGEPPELPTEDPGAPSLCLRDIMEPTRDERHIKRIPLDRIKWRKGYEPCVGNSTPVSEDVRETFYSRAMLYSPQSSGPTIRTFHSLKDTVKVIEGRPGSSTPCVEIIDETFYTKSMLYSPQSSGPTIRCEGRHGISNQIKVCKETVDDCLTVNIMTPRECWRLMGFPEWAYLRASKVSSETQLYDQAGNSIVVEVLEAIFRTMFSDRRVRRQTCLKEFSEAVA